MISGLTGQSGERIRCYNVKENVLSRAGLWFPFILQTCIHMTKQFDKTVRS